MLSLSLCLSLCRSDLLFFERMRVTSLPRLSLSRSFFVGNSQSAHSLFWVVFCRKKGEHAAVFFFKKTPIFLRTACFRHTREALLAGGNKKRTGRQLYERRRHFFSFFLLSPRAKNEHQHCSGTSDRADAGEFRPEKFFFFLFFFFEWWWWFWGVPDAVARRVAVNRCGL